MTAESGSPDCGHDAARIVNGHCYHPDHLSHFTRTGEEASPFGEDLEQLERVQSLACRLDGHVDSDTVSALMDALEFCKLRLVPTTQGDI
ncbi:MAG TPA: hypothetical protein VJQ57_15800 [Acidimicrobiia bacterium]|nr:hypothetical protein [Acidimicrobiia bacterium]